MKTTTPEQDKAKELVHKFSQSISYPDAPELSFDDIKKEWIGYAKQCALICVDQIMKTFDNTDLRLAFWQKVKEEINNYKP